MTNACGLEPGHPSFHIVFGLERAYRLAGCPTGTRGRLAAAGISLTALYVEELALSGLLTPTPDEHDLLSRSALLRGLLLLKMRTRASGEESPAMTVQWDARAAS